MCLKLADVAWLGGGGSGVQWALSLGDGVGDGDWGSEVDIDVDSDGDRDSDDDTNLDVDDRNDSWDNNAAGGGGSWAGGWGGTDGDGSTSSWVDTIEDNVQRIVGNAEEGGGSWDSINVPYQDAVDNGESCRDASRSLGSEELGGWVGWAG